MGRYRVDRYLGALSQHCRLIRAAAFTSGRHLIGDTPILVIGATGKTGHRIVRLLAQRGFPVREGARGGPTPFDWDWPETWARALDGVRAANVSYFPDLAFPGAAEKIGPLTGDARRAGVGSLVLLSGRGERQPRRAR
jgi:hypothetical protein